MEKQCSSTPTKKPVTFRGILLEQTTGSSSSSSNSSGSNTACRTPPSRHGKVKNPFDRVLREHLGTNFLSPSLFTVKPPPPCEEWKWTIDELSLIKPADIDDSEVHNQYESPDSQIESITRSKIDSFFGRAEIVPSPMHQPCKSVPLIKTSTSSVDSEVEVMASSAQTVLTLPPILPEHVENVLKPYFSYTANQQATWAVEENNRLYKRLFEDQFAKVASEEEEEEEEEVVVQSPARCSPQASVRFMRQSTMSQLRTMGTPGQPNNTAVMDECGLSPISCKDVLPRCPSHSESMEASFNVPNCSVLDEPSESPADCSHSSLGTSTSNNWELEYKELQSPARKNLSAWNEMDVSQSNTPKQRIILSHRKKLSDSFGADGAPSDNELELMVTSQTNVIMQPDDSESGYQSNHFSEMKENVSSSKDAPWESLDVVSSTPTKKRKHRQ